MSPRERAISVCIVIHLAALTVTALVGLPGQSRGPDGSAMPRPGVSATLTPLLADLGSAVASTTAGARRYAPIVEASARWYTRRLGLGQLWTMFSEPAMGRRYMKMAFVLDGAHPAGGPTRVMEELVYPASRPDSIRGLVQPEFHLSKVLETAMNELPVGGHAPADLAPVAAYFGDQFRQRILVEGEHIVKTEIWIGFAPTLPAGEVQDSGTRQEHAAALASYLDGPRLMYRAEEPRPGAAAREADIVWTLYAVDSVDRSPARGR
jgi:hypothetical protein